MNRAGIGTGGRPARGEQMRLLFNRKSGLLTLVSPRKENYGNHM